MSQRHAFLRPGLPAFLGTSCVIVQGTFEGTARVRFLDANSLDRDAQYEVDVPIAWLQASPLAAIMAEPRQGDLYVESRGALDGYSPVHCLLWFDRFIDGPPRRAKLFEVTAGQDVGLVHSVVEEHFRLSFRRVGRWAPALEVDRG